MVIWYIFSVLVSCGKKNLATLQQSRFFRRTYLGQFFDEILGDGVVDFLKCAFLPEFFLS
jgi:hypothetical protein